MTDKKRIFTVLCIDGGGVRGIIPARILQNIEERTGKPIAELFDMVGGISTGAIVAGGLTVPDEQDPLKPKYTAENVKDLYFKHAPRIFPEMRFKAIHQMTSSAAYDPRPLEETLSTYFGETRLRESLIHLMIPAIDIKNFKPVWMKSIKGQKDLSLEGWSSMLMRDAIRGATTAPTYFPARYVTTTPNEDVPGVQHRHTLIDGGFYSGNAMRRMLTQARKLAPPDAEIVVVHLGTGMVGNSLSPDEWNRLGPLGMLSKNRGSILMSLAVNISILDMADELRDELGDRFLSFNGNINFEDRKAFPSTDMDDASPGNMKLLENFADSIIKDSAADFDRLCVMLEDRLVAEQSHTASTDALKKLAAHMDTIRTVSTLTKFYRQVLKATTGLADETPRNPQVAEIHRLSRQLTEKHRNELDRVYNLLQDKLENQNKLVNSMKEAGDNVDRFMKNLGDRFNSEAKKPPANDDANKPPAAAKANTAKQPWWKR